tara:strand:- start:342 stop:671 length:330 start_codon:yes stop_codon:yes gene_type:complete
MICRPRAERKVFTDGWAGNQGTSAAGLELAKRAPFHYKSGVKMLRTGVMAVLLVAASGCASYSPFVKGTRIQTMWGYPPELLAKILNIPETDRTRLEDFAPESTPDFVR